MKREGLFNLRLFAVLFASLVLGIAFSVNMIAGIVFFFILTAVVLLLFLKSRKIAYIVMILVVYLAGFFYASGLNWYNEAQEDYLEDGYIVGSVSANSTHDVEGLVTGIVTLDDVTYNGDKISGKTSLVISRKSIEGKIHIGDTLTLKGHLIRDSIDTSALGMVRPYVRGIRYTIEAYRLINVEQGSLSFRDKTVQNVSQVLFERLDDDTAGFLTGMMFGDTGLITDGVKSASRRLGIAHLFAVSGLHVGMIVGFAMMILSRTKLNKKWYLLVLPFLYFYAYMCNYSISVIRACIMVTILLVSHALYMRYDMLSSLGLAGSIILLINPYYLFEVSFVMSFLAVLSIALFSGPLFKFFMRKSDRFKGLKKVLAANLSVNIGLLPIMLHLFGGISLLTVPVNMLLIPIISAIFPIFFLLILIIITVQLDVLIPIVGFPFVLIVAASRGIASLNFVGVNFDVSWYFVVTYVIVMILTSRYVFLNRKLKAVPKIALSLLLIVALVTPSIRQGIYGDNVSVIDAYDSYAITYKDDAGRRVVVLMGDVDKHLLAKSSDMLSHDNIGRVDILVVPEITYEDIDMIDSFNIGLRAKYIMTHDEYAFDTAENISMSDGIEIAGDGNVFVSADLVTIALVSPANKWVAGGNYDVVIAHNKDMNIDNFTSKHYKNFSQSSHDQVTTGFTFCTKNGKITLYNEIS